MLIWLTLRLDSVLGLSEVLISVLVRAVARGRASASSLAFDGVGLATVR